MILGISLSAFTTFHVLLSLIGIASGLIVLGAMIEGKRAPAWTAIFLLTTIAKSSDRSASARIHSSLSI